MNSNTTEPSPAHPIANASYEFAALEFATNYRAALIAEFRPQLRGDLLEVGAGIGQMTAAMSGLAGVDSVTAVEPDAALARQFRARNPELRLIEGTVGNLEVDVQADTVVSINVLEHVADDLAELRRYASILRPRRGHLCLFVPARQELYAPIDRDFGHHRRYAREQLNQQLTRAGFHVLRLNYFNIVGYAAWWLNFKVMAQRSFDPRAVKLFDRVIFPVVHAFETRIRRPPIGQSLIAVCDIPG